MSLRAQLTLWSVLVMAVIVGIVSVVDLAQEINHQFKSTLDRAEYFNSAAVDVVMRAVNRDRTVAIPVALQRDKDELAAELLAMMTASKSLLEIAVCDLQDKILIDSEPSRVGIKFSGYDDFRPLASGSLIDKLRVLVGDSPRYQLTQALAVQGQPPSMFVRVVIFPKLIQREMVPTIQSHAEISVLSLMGAIVAAFLF